MSIINKTNPTPFRELKREVISLLETQAPVNRAISKLAIGMESLSDQDLSRLNSVAEQFDINLQEIVGRIPSYPVPGYCMESARHAAMLSADPEAFFKKVVPDTAVSGDKNYQVVVDSGAHDAMAERLPGMEAYNEAPTNIVTANSIVYNLAAPRQDRFGEALYPVIVIAPNSTGLVVEANVLTIFDDITHKITGALQNYFYKKNLLRAFADPTILKNEGTRVIPVARAENVDKFVDVADIAVTNLDLEGEVIPTAPYKAGIEVDYIGLSQTDALLAKGIMTNTDSIEPGVLLDYIYIKTSNASTLGADVIKLRMADYSQAAYTENPQGNYRGLQMNIQTDSILLTAATTKNDGSALTDLAGIAANNLRVRLKVNFSGFMNIETGDGGTLPGLVTVAGVYDASNQKLDPTSAPADAVVAALTGATIEGYDLKMYRSNINRRQRGQLLDRTKFYTRYPIMLRGPVSMTRPETGANETDAADLEGLITTTHARIANANVTKLLQTAETLANYVEVMDEAGNPPAILGIGTHYILPQYLYKEFDALVAVDSLSSHNRRQDISSALINQLSEMVYRLYQLSQYSSAARAFGMTKPPKVIFATDQVIGRYLQIPGDTRVLGDDFEFEVVTSVDLRMRGKIFIVFTVPEARQGAVHPLNHGNMIWSPELTVVLPMYRDNTVSRELTVMPRFEHIVNCPIMGLVEVSNIDAVLNKMPVNFHNV